MRWAASDLGEAHELVEDPLAARRSAFHLEAAARATLHPYISCSARLGGARPPESPHSSHGGCIVARSDVA